MVRVNEFRGVQRGRRVRKNMREIIKQIHQAKKKTNTIQKQ